MIWKHLLLLATVFLGSASLGAAQIPALPITEMAENVAPIPTMARSVSVAAPVRFMLRYRDSGKSPRQFSYLFAGSYKPDESVEGLLPIARVKSLIFASSSLPLLKLFGGKVELDAFQSTSRLSYAQLGPVGNAGARDFHLPQQGYPGESRALHLSGISLNFHFGGNWRSGSAIQTWRYLPKLLSTVLN